MSSSRRVSYVYDAEIGNYHYGQGSFRTRVAKSERVIQVMEPGVERNLDACLCHSSHRAALSCLSLATTGHVMKPQRVRMTHALIVNYGLYHSMQVIRPRICSPQDMTRFHSDDYINFLKSISPDITMPEHERLLQRLMSVTIAPSLMAFLSIVNYTRVHPFMARLGSIKTRPISL